MISMVEKQELNFVIPEKAWSTSEVTIERIKGRFDWSDYSNPSSSNSNFKIYTLMGKFNMILTANSFNKQRERCLEKNISFYPVLPYSKWKSHLSFMYDSKPLGAIQSVKLFIGSKGGAGGKY